jgi:hypothetical protein
LSLVVIDTRSDPAWDVVQEACDVWGITCAPSLDERGAIVVLLTENDGRVEGSDRMLGGLATPRACRPRLWSVDEPNTLAHEIGHVLGLDHHDDPDNVMFHAPGAHVTPEQTARVQRHAHNLAACVGHDFLD